MTLLQNAVDSIRLGLEDLDNPGAGRQLSATRNLFAGILLVFKEKLRRRSPNGSDEVLLYADVDVARDANGELVVEPKKKKQGKPNEVERRPRKTVDVGEIVKRFKLLDIRADWDRVDTLQDIRNDVEHRYTTASRESIRQAVASTFLVIRDFVTRELDADPREVLGEAVWRRLLEEGEVYEAEERECRQTFAEVVWPSAHVLEVAQDHRCEECDSNLFVITNPEAEPELIELKCRPCGDEQYLGRVAEMGFRARFRENAYLIGRGKESASLARCPECHHRTYVLADDQCALCTYTREHLKCYLCGCEIALDEQDGDGLCGGCIHSNEKNADS